MKLVSNNERQPQAQRNEKCPCGSGIKYKKCCLSKDEARKPATVNLENARHEMEGFMKKIKTIAETKNFSIEDMNKLLVGSSIDDITDEYASLAEDTPKRRAEIIFDQTFDESSSKKRIALAEQAFDTPPENRTLG